MFRNARVQLTTMFALSFFLMLCVFALVRWWIVTDFIDDRIAESIETVVTEVTQSPEYIGPTLGGSASPAGTPVGIPRAGVFYIVLDRGTGAVIDNRRNMDTSALVGLELIARAERGDTVRETVRVEGRRLRLEAAPLFVNGEVARVVLAGEDLASRDRTLHSTAVSFIVAALVGLGAALAVGYVLAGRALRPIARAYEQQRAFVADASHELRAPITVIRTSADLMLGDDLTDEHRTSLEEIRDVAEEAAELVETLLELARLQEPGRAEPDLADVAAVARDECATLGPLLEQHSTSITYELGPALVRVRSMELRLLVRTLVENVLTHTPPGTPALISTRVAGPAVTFAVEDGGPGVPIEALGTIFERFARGSTAGGGGSEKGYGLGLAIVNEIARRNGGTVEASPSLLGGLRVSVTLPLAGG